MAKKIMFIVPITTADDAAMTEYLNSCKSPLIDGVDVVSLENCPRHVENHYYKALIAGELLKQIRRAEEQGYAAAVIGCFYDPFLDAAKVLSRNMPVTGCAEGSMHIASTIANKFSILIGRAAWIPQMEENIRRYGCQHRLCAFNSLDLGVLDFFNNPELTKERLLTAMDQAVHVDHAEAVVLGCGALEFGFFRELQRRYGVPVIDANVAALKYAEFLITLSDCCDWRTSKAGGWESLREGELASWGL